MARDKGVAVEVTFGTNLCPGAIDAECDDRQRKIDYPNSKIFAAGAPELERVFTA
jgi:hypothetical protein